MISKYERGKSNLLREEEFFKKVLDSRYKNTPYSIVKETIGHDWMIYIIESEDVVYGIELAGTKKYETIFCIMNCRSSICGMMLLQTV